jgi:hypothetical protein
MKPIEQQSLAERLIRQHGYRNTHKVLLFVAQWVICCESLDRAPVNIEEYSDWWRVSRQTGYREQKLFRECMPGLETPTPIWEAARVTNAGLFKSKKNAAKLAVQLGLSL